MKNEAYLLGERDRLPCRGKCDPLRAALARRVNDGGVVIAGWQCDECGTWKAVKKALVENIDALPEFDPSIAERIHAERLAHWDAEKQARANAWWARYSAYLRTEKWRKKSALVIQRDVTCQACMSAPATQAHHLTYEHVGDEPLFDLKGVCHRCHEKITKLDRERRESGATPLDKEPS
jgi:hypothetical protein